MTSTRGRLAADLGADGTAERDGELRGEDLARDTADAVRPEELASQAR
jgi:hypothetical protein